MNKREILNGYLDIYSMNDNRTKYALDLDIFKENSKSIYAKGMYGNIYRLEKSTGAVFLDGKKYADKSEYIVSY